MLPASRLCSRMFLVSGAMWLSGAFGDTTEDVLQLHGAPDTIAIATGHRQPLATAPAVATVITAEDIEAIGATTLSEAMVLVPGVNVLNRLQGNHFIFRGVRSDSDFNPDWLIMLDGVPQNDVALGNQRLFISEIPIQNIERIEVIRGPGSALYGTDAFAGVVNVITRKPSDVASPQVRVRGGSFDTAEARYLRPDQLGEIKSLFSLQTRTTEGFRPKVEMDEQTIWDQTLGTNASLAPGHAQTWQDDYNLQWDLERGPLRIRARRWAHKLGIAGLAGSLDDTGRRKSDMNSLDLMYEHMNVAPDWDLRGVLSWYDFDIDTKDVRAYPPGAFGGLFPDGVQDNPGYSERRYYSELAGLYKGWAAHTLTLGTGGARHRLYDVRGTRNYGLLSSGLPFPLPAPINLDDTQTFLPNADRDIYFAYAQDEWRYAADWTLTYGLRYDHYSDFGSTANPRIALVWATAADVTTKFLVGRAFRAPTFTDLYSQNNPSLIGNPNLQPELITTYEIATEYHPSPRLTAGINVTHHVIKDKINDVANAIGTTGQNQGRQEGNGGEIELRWSPINDVSLSAWYAHQRNEVKDTDTDAGFAPRNSANVRVDWRFLPNWFWDTNMHWVADRSREPGDNRPPVTDYTLVNVTLRYKSRALWMTSLSVFNLFDKKARDPSDPGGFDDHLLQPRSIFLELRQNL